MTTESLKETRPTLIAANSSWYLLHYRSMLLKEISKKSLPISMSPIDSSSKELSQISLHIPWKTQRMKDRFMGIIKSTTEQY